MNGASRSEEEALSVSALQRVDEACDRFEHAWKMGQRPRIEAYLVEAPAPECAALLRELLALELLFRRRDGESLSFEEYRQRFPVHAELVAELFGEAGAGVGPHAGEANSSRPSGSTGPDPVATPEAGEPVRLGRYRITGTLGKGGFGVVYQGYDDDLQRIVAIKVPHRDRVSETGDVEIYLAEARVLASLDHPHIVPVHDFGHTESGLCYVVSKFIEGGDLKKKIRKTRPSFTESAGLVATVAEALHHAHRQGLVHRDIKPSNILIDTTGKAYVVDFGLASKEQDFGKGMKFAGTPAYMSPEQARGEGHRLDGRSDIFSLGVVFYELLTGRHPFRSRSRTKLLEQITTVEPRPPRQVDDTIPSELERICLKALSKRASDRYTTAKDMAQDLQHWQAANKSQASPPVAVVSQPAVNIQVLPPTASPSPYSPPPTEGGEGRARGAGSVAPSIPLSTPGSDQYAIQIIPKGLRSFDATDADFFLELLPGPRDRDGLPDSVRFWKSKVEEPDPDKTFAVGLLYGPSGCGKSSLVKAGLLPRLADHVIAVYVEATPEDTETRLLKGLRRHCPGLATGLGLAEAIAALRRGRGLPPDKKVLILLDQFEQWLQAKGVQENTELVQALRQCDGERVQCLVMVRDDFGMAATRLMAALDIPILQGHNFATVDLFDLLHARKILAAYGRAFGRLPEDRGTLTREQKAFLNQAVAGLAQEGKVISVRLALFAEVVKGKDWIPATLKAIGGMDGVGVTFLEEIFAAPSAAPQHRLHEKAARTVLKSLLPETGSDIKGQMQSQQQLREISGYAERPKDFEALLRILDAELRLITPTDPEQREQASGGRQPPEDSPDQGADAPRSPERYYQLTHDYLVPSLREWLTRKQKETRRGRAELRLAQWAASWSDKPENRYLPSWWEWADIRLFTRKRDWTAAQQKMMGRAGKYHAIRGVLATAILLGLTLVGFDSYRGKAIHASALVDRLVQTEIEHVPEVISELGPYRGWVNSRLIEIAKAASSSEKARLHAKLALLPVDPRQVGSLKEYLLEAQPREARVIHQALLPYQDHLREALLAELDRQLQPIWKDPNLDPSWTEPDPALLQLINEAHGLLTERLAFCQTMPLIDFQTVAEGLRRSGYRPIRFRPYATDESVLVAAVWTRDGQGWHMAAGLSTPEIQTRNEKYRTQSFHAVDVTGYIVDGEVRYAALWVKVPAETLSTKMKVGLDAKHLQAEDTPLLKEGYWRATTSLLTGTDGRVLYAVIWSKPAGRDPPFVPTEMVNDSGEKSRADLQVDVHISRAAPPRNGKERCAEQLAAAEKALQAKPDDSAARFERMKARLYLGENEKANEDLCWLIQKWPSEAGFYAYRAMIHARLGRAKDAKNDLAKVQELGRDLGLKMYADAVVSAHLGEEAEGMKRLETAIASNAQEVSFLYQAACAYAVLSEIFAGKDKAKLFADRAVTLLKDAIAGGYSNYPHMRSDADLDPLRDRAGFLLERNYVAVWQAVAGLTSAEVRGHDPSEHLARCKELADNGYRPVSLSAAQIRAKQPLVTASVWHRPAVQEEDKEHLAKRQVNAAVALLKMGRPENIWRLLQHQPDPRVRSYLIHRLGLLGADPQAIAKRLEEEKELSARRALLLCLGEFQEKELPQVERDALVPKILDWYRTDPDPGIHGSAAWLLQQWGQKRQLQQIDKELATGEAEGQRRWYVNRQVQTFAILRGAEFLMGSPLTEAGREGRDEDRKEPLHKKRIGRTFAIATHEVTVQQFLKFRKDYPYSKEYAPTPDCPVNGIGWHVAAEYCNWLSEQERIPSDQWCYLPNPAGKYEAGMKMAPNYLQRTGYRLPTEAEWEYACRAEALTSRYYGETDELLEKYAWSTKNSQNHSMPVGSRKPNDRGLFDMLGNSAEWTQDPVHYYYPVNRFQRLSEDQEHNEPVIDRGFPRIFRGGAYSTVPLLVRCATRFNYEPTTHVATLGFRLARTTH